MKKYNFKFKENNLDGYNQGHGKWEGSKLEEAISKFTKDIIQNSLDDLTKGSKLGTVLGYVETNDNIIVIGSKMIFVATGQRGDRLVGTFFPIDRNV